MKLLIKLLVAALIANAAFRCGSAALTYYQLKDQAQQLLLFGQGQSEMDLARQILDEATKRSVPLREEGLEVRRDGARTVADVQYTQNIEVFPAYFYPVTFSFNVESFGLAGAGANAPPRRP